MIVGVRGIWRRTIGAIIPLALLIGALASCGSDDARLAACRVSERDAVRAPAVVRQPLPLVVVLHPDGLDGPALARLSGVSAQVERRGFVALFPTALDLRSVSGAVARLVDARCADARRISLLGFSRGATAAAQLTCRWPGRLVAVVAIAGWYATPAACARAPASVSEIHGTADETLPVRESQVAAWLKRWRRTDACVRSPGRRTSPGVRRSSWLCARGQRIEQVRLLGAGHGWPGEPALAPPGRYVRFDATRYSLDFMLHGAAN
jgi:polyhydroxybutyrate depolymerase